MTPESDNLKTRVAELEECNKLALSLTAVTDIYQTLDAIGEFCKRICRADKVAILLHDPSTQEDTQTLVRSVTPGDKAIDHRVNQVVSGWFASHTGTFRSDDIAATLRIPDATARMLNLGAGLAIPLDAAGKMIGFINMVHPRGGGTFTDDDERVASAIAPLAAQFIQRAKVHTSLSEDNRRLKTVVKQQTRSLLLGDSGRMEEVRRLVSKAAQTSSTVLLLGETGTGKEVAAKAIHFESARAEKPFVAVNCAAIPATLFESELFGHERGSFTGATDARKGKFELAKASTLFLDEISAMPLDLQAKLLRALEDRTISRVGASGDMRVDVRVIAASNIDLNGAIAKGAFRSDLFYRLNVIPIQLPALSDRKEDIPLLAQKFLEEFSAGSKIFDEKALTALQGMEWRGNVRELRNTIERASVFVEDHVIVAEHLRSMTAGPSPSGSAALRNVVDELLQSKSEGENVLEVIEKEIVEIVLAQTGGNMTQAARLLGIDRKAFSRRLEKHQHGLSSDDN
jgi:transcriptional regulator with GAF, ATPase, and Fis domain